MSLKRMIPKKKENVSPALYGKQLVLRGGQGSGQRSALGSSEIWPCKPGLRKNVNLD